MSVPVHQVESTSHSQSIQRPHAAITDDMMKGLVRNEVSGAAKVNTDLVRLYVRRVGGEEVV